MKAGRRPHRLALRAGPIVVALALAACQAGQATPTATPGGSATQSAPAWTPTDQASAMPTTFPEATEPPPEPPILEDEAFLGEAAGLCEEVAPPRAYDVAKPRDPPGRAPGYLGLHIVLLGMRGADGRVEAPPPVPDGGTYYPTATSPVAIPGATEALAIEAPVASRVDVLACVALRPGDSRTYTAEREIRVTALDAVVWVVDRQARQIIGSPWVVEAGLPILLNPDRLIDFERLHLNPADVRADLLRFLGLAVPMPGAFQGGDGSFMVAEYDKPAALPDGTRLLPGFTFVLRLVVLPESAGRIDFVDILCAPSGRVAGDPLRVATGVDHDLGTFSVASADVSISGEFTSETEATGSIRAVSSKARDCGVPRSATWYVGLAASVRASDSGYELYLP
jgi:hypothetical protein